MKLGPLATYGTVVLAVGIAFASATEPAVAATPSASENLDYWWDTYGVDSTHAAGITGAGVKVAVLEEQINPDLPTFSGRNLRISETPVCKDRPAMTSTNTDKGTRHGSTMAAIIIGNGTGAGSIRGIAPDADVTFYGYGPEGRTCAADSDTDLTPWGYGVKLAVDSGAKIILTAIGGPGDERDAPAIAYAIAQGAVLIAASANPVNQIDYVTDDQGSMNGVVSATAIDREGNLQKADDGAAWVIPQTTVVTGGADLPTLGKDGDWNQTGTGTGSSYAAPIVGGMLALAAQKYPQSTGNQLVQALIATTNAERHAPKRTEDGYGYGAAWLPTLLQVDPTVFPDETPLVNKSGKFPTTEQIEAAKAGGFIAPSERGRSFDQYGDEKPTGPDFLSFLPWVVIGIIVLVVLAAVTTVVIIVTQRRKAGKGATS